MLGGHLEDRRGWLRGRGKGGPLVIVLEGLHLWGGHLHLLGGHLKGK
jgi:hypothetical protein